MMGVDLHSVVGRGSHPASKPGHTNDRWMVPLSAYPRESLTSGATNGRPSRQEAGRRHRDDAGPLLRLRGIPGPGRGALPITITGGSLTAASNTFSLVADPLNPPPCPLPGDPPKLNTLALNTDTPVAGQWTVTGTFTTYFRGHAPGASVVPG